MSRALGAPGVPLARGEDGGDELGLDLLEVRPVVKALDQDAQGPGNVSLDLLPQLVLGPDGLEDPDMFLGEGGEAVDGHLQGHLVAAAFSEVDHDLVALDGGYAAHVPGAVEDKVARVKGDVLLEIGHRLMHGAVGLGDVREPDIVVKVGMAGVFALVALDDLLAEGRGSCHRSR